MKYLPHLGKLVKHNQGIFLDYVEQIKEEPSLHKRCVLGYQAASFATRHNTDIFVSQEIEQPFLELAEKLPNPGEVAWEAGSVLHVATEVYTTGGHSRCIERWIQHMTEQKHSCFLIKQQALIPSLLTQLIKANGGELIQANPDDSMVATAMELRNYASKFQYVVLHTHMNDPVALIAFGSEKFKRPIILFNHAAHIFWLGASIADSVADLAEFRHREITLRARAIPRSGVLNIPIEKTPFATIGQRQARQQLGISPQAKVIFASGHPRKFDPVGTPDFADIIRAILQQDPGVYFYIAGASPKQTLWKKLPANHRKQVVFTGRLDYKTEYPLYLSAADMVLDSMPVSGGTAVSDAVKAQKPVLAIRNTFRSDFINNSEAGCADLEELVAKTLRLFNEPDYKAAIYSSIHEKWYQEVDCEAWKKRCREAYAALPEQHCIYACAPVSPGEEVSEISLFTSMWTEPETSLMKKVRRWIFSKDRAMGIYRIFGIRFRSRKIAHMIIHGSELSIG